MSLRGTVRPWVLPLLSGHKVSGFTLSHVPILICCHVPKQWIQTASDLNIQNNTKIKVFSLKASGVLDILLQWEKTDDRAGREQVFTEVSVSMWKGISRLKGGRLQSDLTLRTTEASSSMLEEGSGEEAHTYSLQKVLNDFGQHDEKCIYSRYSTCV